MSICTCNGTKGICDCNTKHNSTMDHMLDAHDYLMNNAVINIGGRAGGKIDYMRKIQEFLSRPIEPRRRYTEEAKRIAVDFGNELTNFRGLDKICEAFNYPSNLLMSEEPMKWSNLNPDYMTNESLQKGIKLEKEIRESKRDIEDLEMCHSAYEISLSLGHSTRHFDAKLINFAQLKKQMLSAARKKLSEMEKEFAKL
jgi:hypothetical protein